ncbi:hypothetical protein F4778DRAFT_195861 [Xylariomycetidae sp. FL2044]|nr:hypothetical protein F4778DRAFT_195861 [Xylariomycetidae sp. FL2044]
MRSRSRSSSTSMADDARGRSGSSPPPTQDYTKTESSDDETKLAQASSKFAGLDGPSNIPSLPRSVAPTNFRYGSAFPSRGNNPPQTPSGQALARYRGSISSNESWSLGGPAPHSMDPALHMAATIHKHITTLIQYTNISPSATGEFAQNLQGRLRDISQMVNSALDAIRRERDEAAKGRNEERENFKRAMEIEKRLKKDLMNAIKSEGEAKAELDECYHDLKEAQDEYAELQSSATKFKDSHVALVAKFQEDEDRHRKQVAEFENEIKELQTEIKRLRRQIQATKTQTKSVGAGQPSSSSGPESAKKAVKPIKSKLTEEQSAMLLNGLKESAANTAKNKNRTTSGATFKPNPEAPVWSPSGPEPAVLDKGKEIATTATQDDDTSVPPMPSDKFMMPYESNMGSGRTTRNSNRRPNTMGNEVAANRFWYNSDGKRRNATQSTALVPANAIARQVSTPIQPPRIRRDKEIWDQEDIDSGIRYLYEVIKGYIVNCHQGLPPQVPLLELDTKEPQIWSYICSIVYHDGWQASAHMKYLLSHKPFVPFVIQRICADFLYQKIIVPSTFMGFSDDHDHHLSALQKEITTFARSTGNNPKQTALKRQRYINDHARLIRSMLANSDYQAFRQAKIDHHTEMLRLCLAPLRSSDCTEEKAQKAMRLVVSATWDVSTKIWASGMTLHFHFPETGDKFAYGTMDALNIAQFGKTVEELQWSQMRLSLIVTPSLSIRDDRDGTNLRTYHIRKAEVLVMK